MALPAKRDDLTGLEPAEAKHYTKGDDGKFTLDAPGYVLKATVEGKLEEGNKKRAELSAQLEALQSKLTSSISAEEHNRIKGMLEDLESGKGGDKFKAVVQKEVDKLKSQMEENLRLAKEEGAKFKTASEASSRELKNYKIDAEVGQAALDAGVNKKGLRRYLDSVRGEFDIVGDKVVPVKRNADGSSTPLIGEDMQDLKVGNYITKSHKSGDMEMFFAQPSGGGALGNNNGKGSPGAHSISRADARDTEKYRTARDAAEKAGTTLQILPDVT